MTATLNELKSFTSSPVYQSWAQQHAASVAEQRKAAVAALADLEKRRAKECVTTQEAVDKARKAAEAAYEAWQETKRGFGRAEADYWAVSARFDREATANRRKLIETADPKIDEFITEISNDFESRRHRSGKTREYYERTPWTESGFTHRVQSNAESLEAWCFATMKAIKDAEALKLSVVEDVPAALEKIRAAIPQISFTYE